MRIPSAQAPTQTQVTPAPASPPTADAARRDVVDHVASSDLPAFVSELVGGVFHSIVDASARQMEAYAALVASVAMTLEAFEEDNVTSRRDAVTDVADTTVSLAPKDDDDDD